MQAGLATMAKDTELQADAVFEGGGVKGIGLVGALTVAEEMGYRWVNIAGTSAGAIIAALLAAGYRAVEIKDIMTELDYHKFKDGSPLDRVPLVGKLASLILEEGIYEGNFFKKWIRGLLKQKHIETFGDLIMQDYKDDERYRFKLRVVASDITRGRLLVLPQDIVEFGMKPEELEVAAAIRMTMSIPFFYEPVRLKHRTTGETSYIVDGGLLSNFPVWLFDTEQDTPQWPTFGFKLVEPEEGTPRTVKGPISLLSALFSTMMEAHDRRYIHDADFKRTIAIPTLGVKTTDFDITKEKSEALYQSGRKAAEKFFAAWNFSDYVQRHREKQRK